MTAAHPDDATLEQLAMNELAPARRAEVLAHVAACAGCSKLWLGLQALASGARAIDPAVVPAVPIAAGADDDELAARRARRARVLIAAGAIAVAAAAVLFVALPRGSHGGGGGGGSDVVRGADPARRLSVLAMADPVPRDDIDLAWMPVYGATRYRVTVFSADGRAAWGPTDVGTVKAKVPHLAPGTYRWRVEALRGGTPLAASELIPFEVK